jgi:MFS family permease
MTTAAPDAPHDAYAALRVPAFRRFILGLVAITVAVQVQGTVVGWQVYDLTGDPLALGLIGLAEALPYILAALPSGWLADHRDRRGLVLGSVAVLLVCSGALLLLSTTDGLADQVRLGGIYGTIVLSGLARAVHQPARSALAAQLVPRQVYGNSIAWRSSTWQASSVAGPALGGLLYALGSARLAYAVDLALVVLALIFFARVPRQPLPEREPGAATGMLASLKAGVDFVFADKVVFGALSLDLFSVFFGGAVALLPIYAKEILHVGPTGLGVLRAAPAAGSVLMSLTLAHRPPLGRAGATLLWAVALFGLTTIGFGVSTSFPLSVALLALGGAADNVSVVVRSTLLQIRTPMHLLGRVMAVNAIFIGSSNELGMFESGAAAKLLGTVPSVVFGGAATLGVVGWIAWAVPPLRQLRRLA